VNPIDTASTPKLRNVPLLGRMFQTMNRNDQDTELIVVVTPVVVRSPIAAAAAWSFPNRDELVRSVLAGTAALAKP